MSDERPYLSVVIPLYNEAESLPVLFDELYQALNALERPFEIICVDDGSSDASFEILKAHHDADPMRLHVIRFRRNFGKTAALSLAFKRARGEIVATMDADLQDDPRELSKLLAKLDEGYDLVSAWRERRQDPPSKTWPSRVFNRMVSSFTGIRLHDFNVGFKVYRVEAVRELQLYGDLHRYIPVLAHWKGFRVGEAAVAHRPRRFGKSKYDVWGRIRGFFDVLVVLFITHYLRRPLQLFGMLGMISLFIGLVIGLYLTYLRLFGPGIGWRPALFLDILAIVVGVQFISMGLLGEMIRNFAYRSEDEYSVRAEL